MRLTHEDVREILRLLDESPYDELKIEAEGFSLSLKRTAGPRQPRQSKRMRRSKHLSANGATR